jgi:long-chain acyl-CoA synthetase
LTPNIWTGYGATETDGIAMVDTAVATAEPDIVGFLFPWVDAEIVDSADQTLANGHEGLLRVRSAQTIAGYYANEIATQRNFRGGWFYSGDRGVITAQGALRITGRVEDLIMRDGIAIAPLPIETAIRAFPHVLDVAVFPVTGAGGVQEICAALVLAADADLPALRSAMARLGPAAPSRILVVERLPRSGTGKVLRRLLADWALRGAPL